jgi:hypothetical protein
MVKNQPGQPGQLNIALPDGKGSSSNLGSPREDSRVSRAKGFLK